MIDKSIAALGSGLIHDANEVASIARGARLDFKKTYGNEYESKGSSIHYIAQACSKRFQKLSLQLQRPYGCALVLGGVISSVPELYVINPSGGIICRKHVAFGINSESIRKKLKMKFNDGDCGEGCDSLEEGIKLAAALLHEAKESMGAKGGDELGDSGSQYDIEIKFVNEEGTFVVEGEEIERLVSESRAESRR